MLARVTEARLALETEVYGTSAACQTAGQSPAAAARKDVCSLPAPASQPPCHADAGEAEEDIQLTLYRLLVDDIERDAADAQTGRRNVACLATADGDGAEIDKDNGVGVVANDVVLQNSVPGLTASE